MTDYILHLADNALILGHRNSEWTGHGPILEQDIALSNISLDLIGQARHLYQYASILIADGRSEDDLAFFRDEHEFKNSLLVEQENGDWGKTIMRQFLFSAYAYPLLQRLRAIDDGQLGAIAEKSLKEVTYHLRWSSEWVIRLGDGTAESAQRMQTAADDLWKYTDDLLIRPSYTPKQLDFYNDVRKEWASTVREIFTDAGLNLPQPEEKVFGGTDGRHTPHLSKLLQEMQYMQRTYPGVEW